MINLKLKNLINEDVTFSYDVRGKLCSNTILARSEMTLSVDSVSLSMYRGVDSGIFSLEFVSENKKQTSSAPKGRKRTRQPAQKVEEEKSE